MSDVILVYPRTGMDIGSTVAPPHSLLAVAAPLDKAGYSVKIIDQRVESQWLSKLISQVATKPLFVGITCMTGTQVKYAMGIAKVVRKESMDIPIIWGGPHSTLLPEQTLESGLADFVCIGEADDTIIPFAQALKGQNLIFQVPGITFKTNPLIGEGRYYRNGATIRYKNDGDCCVMPKVSPLCDMESLLPTPWHLVDVERYIHPDIYLKKGRNLDVGQSSRGCPFNCRFCSSASIRQRKWRGMSASKSLDVINDAVKRFNLTGIWLRDDEFYIDRDRAAEIAVGIIPLKIKWYTSGTRVDVFNKTPDDQIRLYKRSGASTLKFGAESGSNRILRFINKGITKEQTLEANCKAKKHGITPAFALMLGFPTETFAEINETIDMAKQIRKENPQAQFETMAIYTALPGTPMWNMAVEYGLKPPTKLEEWADWNFDEYDTEGKRIPWFNANERQSIANLCYISMLSNAVPNVIDSLDNTGLSALMKVGYAIPHKYYQWRFFGKHYRYTGELGMVRALRKRLFYNGRKVWR